MVIAYAILAGEIRDSELMETAHVQYLDKEVLKNFELDGHFQVSIVVTRDTRWEEVKKVFNNDIQRVFQEMWPKPDTFKKVRRDRGWYWKWKINNLSWSQLHKSIEEEEGPIKSETVRTAVRQYQAALKITLYSSIPPGG